MAITLVRPLSRLVARLLLVCVAHLVVANLDLMKNVLTTKHILLEVPLTTQ